MVSGVKIKKSKNKNFQSCAPGYPRDIWEFIAKSTERVYNTRTGALLKDVLDFQALTPRSQEQIHREDQFPKTCHAKIDPERLKPRAVSVDADVLEARRLAQVRHTFLEGSGTKNKKDNLLGKLKGHFDVAATEEMVDDYKRNRRPKWLQPKSKEVRHEEKKKEFDPSRGISKAEQEEMLTQAIFDQARHKSERARDLRKAFHHNLLEGKLLRVQADLGLNRVFHEPERRKLSDLDSHFAKKMIDPNLDIRIIESASPTKFFEMVHRRLNPSHYHPERYEDIVQSLTPEPEDCVKPNEFDKSPYLTYLRPRHKVEVKQNIPGWKWEYGRYVPRPGDEDRWGRRTIDAIEGLAERINDEERPGAYVPQGLGRSVQLNMTKRSQDSPWMGGGPGPIPSPAPAKEKEKVSPVATIRKTESSTFITQKSTTL